MTRSLFSALVVTALATTANSGPGGLPDGTFDASGCSAPTDGRVVLQGNELSFHESSYTLSNPQGLRGLSGPVLVDTTCSGEGETWETRFILSQAKYCRRPTAAVWQS